MIDWLMTVAEPRLEEPEDMVKCEGEPGEGSWVRYLLWDFVASGMRTMKGGKQEKQEKSVS